MRHATIKRRLDALENALPVKFPRVAIVLQWPDGRCSHGGMDFRDMEEAIALIKADEIIPVQVTDYSLPQAPKEG